MQRTLKIGQTVKVADELGVVHDGLVTNQWGKTTLEDADPRPCINVLYVVDDDSRRDPYGNQIERLSSCSHKLSTPAPGRYWFFPDETF